MQPIVEAEISMTALFAWICAGVAAIATLGAAYFFDRGAEEGISIANERAGIANESAGRANERAAQLEKEAEIARARANEAELKLEQLRERIRPRSINGEAFLKSLNGKPKAPVEIVFTRDDAECFQLAMQIRDWLKLARWDVGDATAILSADTPRLANYTSSMSVGGQPSGVTIVQRATEQADFNREIDRSFGIDGPVDTPGKALAAALGEALGSISRSMSFDTGLVGTLRVVVAPKPQLN